MLQSYRAGTHRIGERREKKGQLQKVKAPRIARGFKILDDVRQTLIMINGALELSRNFGIERLEEGKGVEP